MIGVPKVCKTKNDYERIHQMAKDGRIPKEEVLTHLRGLLNTKNGYFFDRVLDDTEDPDGDPPEYIVVENEQDDGTVQRRQNKLQDNPNGRIYKLGFTVSGVQQMISDLEV